jgi:hypothetical protein
MGGRGRSGRSAYHAGARVRLRDELQQPLLERREAHSHDALCLPPQHSGRLAELHTNV